MAAAPLPRSPEQLAAENAVLRVLVGLTARYAIETGAALQAFSAELVPVASGLPADVQARLAAILNGYAATTTLYVAESAPFMASLNLLDLAAAGGPANRLRL
jgi:hypothetical protein